MTQGLSQQTVEALASGEPEWLRSHRLTAWRVFEKLPLPTKRDVEWQRFDIRALKLDKISIPVERPTISEQHTPVPAELTKQGVIFCDMQTAIAQHADLVRAYLGKSIAADEPRKFGALHAAFWKTGTFLYVPENVRIPFPLEAIHEFSGQNAGGFPHTLVVIEPGAEATLVQKFVGGPAAGSNGVPSVHASGSELIVKESAHLHYVSLQNFSPNVFDFTLKRANVAHDAEIDWVLGMFGASFQRYDVECVMEGEGGTSFMYAVGVLDQHQQFGQFTKQHHKKGNTVSDLMFKNVLRDAAVTNYAGMIKVERNANGTNAYQANRNLVLSDKVKCDTKPILEIESNQLRCTHGATVGRLDENQLFYLRSRGLTATQARDVLIEAFLDPVLARIRVENVQKEFATLIHNKVVRK
jgi:Fe-S cluster assembly protein SufD